MLRILTLLWCAALVDEENRYSCFSSQNDRQACAEVKKSQGFFAILFKRCKSRSSDHIKGSWKIHPKPQATVHTFLSIYFEALNENLCKEKLFCPLGQDGFI